MRRIYSFLRFHLASNPLNACFYYDEWSKNAIFMQFLQKRRRFLKDLFCRMKNLHLWINRKNRLNTKYLHIYFLLPLRTSWNCSDFYSKIDRLCTIVISSSRLLILKILCVPFELNLHTCFPLLSLFLIRALRLVWTKILQIEPRVTECTEKTKINCCLWGLMFLIKPIVFGSHSLPIVLDVLSQKRWIRNWCVGLKTLGKQIHINFVWTPRKHCLFKVNLRHCAIW